MLIKEQQAAEPRHPYSPPETPYFRVLFPTCMSTNSPIYRVTVRLGDTWQIRSNSPQEVGLGAVLIILGGFP